MSLHHDEDSGGGSGVINAMMEQQQKQGGHDEKGGGPISLSGPGAVMDEKVFQAGIASIVDNAVSKTGIANLFEVSGPLGSLDGVGFGLDKIMNLSELFNDNEAGEEPAAIPNPDGGEYDQESAPHMMDALEAVGSGMSGAGDDGPVMHEGQSITPDPIGVGHGASADHEMGFGD